MQVPKDKDYEEFMQSFVEFFEKTMIESHQYANNNTESKTPDEEKVNE
jgi:hypothetical protein